MVSILLKALLIFLAWQILYSAHDLFKTYCFKYKLSVWVSHTIVLLQMKILCAVGFGLGYVSQISHKYADVVLIESRHNLLEEKEVVMGFFSLSYPLWSGKISSMQVPCQTLI